VAQAPSVDRQDNSTGATAAPPPIEEEQASEFATESNAARFIPYYTMFRNPDSDDEEFVILRPFVPFSTNDRRTELQAYLTASSNPETYGTLTSYVVQQDPLPPGPLRVADQAESEPTIGPALTLQSNEETRTRVVFGDLQLVPVTDGLLYIRPVYVVSPDVTEFRFVIVSTGNNAVMANNLSSALAQLFPGFDAEIGDRVPDEGDEGEDASGEATGEDATTGDDTAPDDTTDATVRELLDQAEALFAEAQQHLEAGDLGAYQDAVNRAQQLVTEAIQTLGE
jgi:uncharacterized membrane protein (UPF0182 family)